MYFPPPPLRMNLESEEGGESIYATVQPPRAKTLAERFAQQKHRELQGEKSVSTHSSPVHAIDTWTREEEDEIYASESDQDDEEEEEEEVESSSDEEDELDHQKELVRAFEDMSDKEDDDLVVPPPPSRVKVTFVTWTATRLLNAALAQVSKMPSLTPVPHSPAALEADMERVLHSDTNAKTQCYNRWAVYLARKLGYVPKVADSTFDLDRKVAAILYDFLPTRSWDQIGKELKRQDLNTAKYVAYRYGKYTNVVNYGWHLTGAISHLLQRISHQIVHLNSGQYKTPLAANETREHLHTVMDSLVHMSLKEEGWQRFLFLTCLFFPSAANLLSWQEIRMLHTRKWSSVPTLWKRDSDWLPWITPNRIEASTNALDAYKKGELAFVNVIVIALVHGLNAGEDCDAAARHVFNWFVQQWSDSMPPARLWTQLLLGLCAWPCIPSRMVTVVRALELQVNAYLAYKPDEFRSNPEVIELCQALPAITFLLETRSRPTKESSCLPVVEKMTLIHRKLLPVTFAGDKQYVDPYLKLEINKTPLLHGLVKTAVQRIEEQEKRARK